MTKEKLEAARTQLVVKSNDLIQKTRYTLTLQQQKIILYLISKIKPTDDDFQTYSFDLHELCDICGIEYNGKNYQNFKHSIKKLHDNSFWIETETSECLISWVRDVQIMKDSSLVQLRLDPRLRPYLLQLREKFTQYELGTVLQMKSKYSLRIYELLKSYVNLGIIQYSLESFKKLLDIGTEYADYRNLKKFVIEKAVSEINQFSDISVTFHSVKTGRCITGLVFEIQEKDSLELARLRLAREMILGKERK